jgi:dTDP-4-dehydrorhamnose reductase
MTNVVILGASGMLGNAMLDVLSRDRALCVTGTVRSPSQISLFANDLRDRVMADVDVMQPDDLITVFRSLHPQVVINCVGIVKQLTAANDTLAILPLNTLLPHRLSRLCDAAGARMIHISTDCVFAGDRGRYSEDDIPDARDLYGLSKALGEVTAPPHVTLRTSIIGHELTTAHSLIDWFLAQQDGVRGFRQAFFSGLPTVELARVVRDFVIPDATLSGLFHVAADRISKFDLLTLTRDVYARETTITPDDTVTIDRSLNASRFTERTGYRAPPWADLVAAMHAAWRR